MLLGLLEADARYWETWRRISSRSADQNTEYDTAKVIYLEPHEIPDTILHYGELTGVPPNMMQ